MKYFRLALFQGVENILVFFDVFVEESTSVYIPKFEGIKAQMQRDTLQQKIDQLNVDFVPSTKRKI